MHELNDRLSIQHWFCTRCTGVQNEIQVKMVSTRSTSLILFFFFLTPNIWVRVARQRKKFTRILQTRLKCLTIGTKTMI